MILHSFKNRFEALKLNGNHIQYVLDIGAYRGDFTETIKSVWPTTIVRQIEADERQKEYLDSNAIFALLGDEQKEIDFYTLSEEKITTGSSIFKELTSHYTNESTIVIKKSMTTIDELDKIYKFYGNWDKYGLIKIDTQGSELLILSGATEFLASRKPRYILLECSVIQYNLGAPKITEVIESMSKYNYEIKDIFDLSYDSKANLMQIDILFERLL